MQTYSLLRICSFSHKGEAHTEKGFTQPSSRAGFTLVELLISISIIGVITTIVLSKYTSFDSSVLLKSAAYDIALSLREAQVKSVSVMRNGVSDPNAFKYPLGVTFTPDQKSYTVFRYLSSTDPDPFYDAPPSGLAEDIRTFTLDRSMEVVDVCVTDSGGEDCSISQLDISFRRPEFNAIFNAIGYGGASANINEAKIIVGSPSGTDQFSVTISKFGQISVGLEP